MKRILTAVMITCLAATVAFAQQEGQKQISVDIAPMLSVPVGDLSNVASVGFGAELILNYPVMDNLVATGAVGYLYHLKKNNATYTAIPVMVGAKYYFVPGVFAGAELGFHRWSWEVDTGFFGTVSNSSTELTITPQIGYEFGKFALTGQYVFSGDLSYVAARVSFPVWSN
jgi:hypothetical protein